MPTILEALPTQAQKEQLVMALNQVFDPKALGLDLLQNLTVNNLASTFLPAAGLSFALDALPAVPSPTTLLAQIQTPLASIAALQAIGQFDLSADNPFAALDKPTFPLEEIILPLANTLSPFLGAPMPLGQEPFTALLLDLTGLKPLLAELVQIDGMPPQQRVETLLQAADTVVTTLRNPDNLVNFATQAIPTFYRMQSDRFAACLPLVALENALACLQMPAETSAFSVRYQGLLDELEQLGVPDAAQLRQWTEPWTEQWTEQWTETTALIVPALQTLATAGQTLEWLQANNVQPLATTAAQLLNLGDTAELFLQPLFAQGEQLMSALLDAVRAPIQQFGALVQPMQAYLDQAITTAQTLIDQFAQTLTTALEQVPQVLATSREALARVATQLADWVAKLDVATLIAPIKSAGAQLAAGIDCALSEVEAITQKLAEGFNTLQQQVKENVATAFQTLEDGMRKLLAMITDLLTNQEVQAVFKQARQALESFQRVLEQITLKPVFDLVLTQTRTMENSIKAIDAARLGVPQRTALKIGVQIIKEVKVDEQIKPELLAALAQLRDPLVELIAFLNEKVGVIEQAIAQFDPGALVQRLIEKAGPYQQFIDTLEKCRPSQLLDPLQDLSTKVKNLVNDLAPDPLLSSLQALADQLAALLSSVAPTELNRLLFEAIQAPLAQLTSLQEQQLAAFLQTLRENLSLEKMLAGTGLQTLNDALAWPLLLKLLRGDDWALIEQAIEAAKTAIGDPPIADHPLLLPLQTTLANITQQQNAAADAIVSQLRALEEELTPVNWAALQQRREQLLAHYPAAPAVQQLLQALDLTPVLQLQSTVAALLALSPPILEAALAAIAEVLQQQAVLLQQIAPSTLQTALPALFSRQIGDPLHQLLARLQEKLAPLATAVESLETLTAALAALPARLADLVTDLLTTTQTRLTALLLAGIDTLQTFSATVTELLQPIDTHLQAQVAQLSPSWLLNAFGVSDFITDAASNGGTPAGLVRMAAVIVNEASELPWPARLRAKLNASELDALRGAVNNTPLPETLGEEVRALVYQALNRVLDDGQALEATDLAAIKDHLQTQLAAATMAATAPAVSGPQQSVASRRRYQLEALQTQITASETAYQQSQDGRALLRFKRVLLEASYPDELAMSLQSLHPTLVAQLAQLYPAATVHQLDDLYINIVEQVKGLPQQVLSKPLNDAFRESKELFLAHFAFAGLLEILERKLAGLDNDLTSGLVRLSVAYQRLLLTFDQRLAAAG